MNQEQSDADNEQKQDGYPVKLTFEQAMEYIFGKYHDLLKKLAEDD